MTTQTQSCGISFLSLLALLFIALKLTGQIGWSWWWVLAPLWGPFALVFGILLLAMAGAGAIQLFGFMWRASMRIWK